MKNIFKKENLRAAAKLPLVAGLILGTIAALPFQIAFSKITGRPNTGLTNSVFKAGGKIMNMKMEFNEASAPLVRDKPAIFVLHHAGRRDFRAVAEFANTAFMMSMDFFNIPVLGPLAKMSAYASGFIGTTNFPKSDPDREAKLAAHRKSVQGQEINHLNNGLNLGWFGAGVCTGREVPQFSQGGFAPLYGAVGEYNGKEVKLERDDVVAQAIALHVVEVDGKNLLNKEDWSPYCFSLDKRGFLTRVWHALKAESVTIRLSPQPALDPKDFASERDLANALHKQIVDAVNPGQKLTRSRREYLEWLEEQPHKAYDPAACLE